MPNLSIPAITGNLAYVGRSSVQFVPKPSNADVTKGNFSILLAGIYAGSVKLQVSSDNGATWSDVITYTTQGLYQVLNANVTDIYKLNVVTLTRGQVSYDIWNNAMSDFDNERYLDPVARHIAVMGVFNNPITIPATTVALLPAAASYLNGMQLVTDANAPTLGSNVTGGGAIRVLVVSDGTNWKVA